jgi:hypothetical protein
LAKARSFIFSSSDEIGAIMASMTLLFKTSYNAEDWTVGAVQPLATVPNIFFKPFVCRQLKF